MKNSTWIVDAGPFGGATLVDAAGALLLPGFVEGHAHLDKTTWGMPWYRNAVGPRLVDRIDNERRWRAASGHDIAQASLALEFLRRGTTRLRTHVDIDTDASLRHLKGVVATRDALANVLDMQIVASAIGRDEARAGTRALLDDVLAHGADVLGALDPSSIDGDPAASLDISFALATKHDKPIDLHLREPGDLGAFTFDLLLDRVEAHGYQGRVVVSHAFCLCPTRGAVRTHRAAEGRVADDRARISERAAPARGARSGRHGVRRQRRYPRCVDAVRFARHARTCDVHRDALRHAARRRPRRRVRVRIDRRRARAASRAMASRRACARTSCSSMPKPSRKRSRCVLRAAS